MGLLQGCDTFVVLPPSTDHNFIIFGKNSDRPGAEVQEIAYFPAFENITPSKLKCTYIEIDQVPKTQALILSKPAWMWGAEMGANESGVMIGNEAVWTNVQDDHIEKERLLGMDLLRLGLERGSSAEQSLTIMTSLLEQYGQGGPCSEDSLQLTYHNSFLIVDPLEVWVLETAGPLWAAEKIISGYRNISNTLTIGTKIDRMSVNLKNYAIEKKLWDGKGPFNFTKSFSSSSGLCARLENGRKLLERFSSKDSFSLKNMASILRDKPSGICMTRQGLGSVTTSSQISILAPKNVNFRAVHFFTGTPDPSESVFKPFVFPQCGLITTTILAPLILAPKFSDDEDPAKLTPRFTTKVDRRHTLYKLHEMAHNNGNAKKTSLQLNLSKLEKTSFDELSQALCKDEAIGDPELIFNEAVEAEVKSYRNLG